MSILLDIWTSGIDFDLPGNGGPDCLAHSSLQSRLAETALALVIFVACLRAGLSLKPSFAARSREWPSPAPLRKILLVSMLAGYSMETAYKAITKQFIFMVNPCHLMCLIHLYLLSNLHSGSGFKLIVYRLHLFFLHGPCVAVIFPVTNTRFLPGEVAAFWVEHALLLVIPVYLIRHYTVPVKTFKNFASWTLMAYAVWGFYHYLILFPLAWLSLGNLNSILCPAITDPFRGDYYRFHGLWHQFLFTLLSGFLWWCICHQEDGEPARTSHQGSVAANGFQPR